MGAVFAGPIWQQSVGDGPLIATAIHNGHDVRHEVARHLALGHTERLREEDPFTAHWTEIAPTRVVGRRSRFEVDLNRPREKAVYRTPEDAWGLAVWRDRPPEEIINRSLAQYDEFYDSMWEMFCDVARIHGQFVVFDLHSYNHRRTNADGPLADPAANPRA